MVTTAEEFKKRKRLAVIMGVTCFAVLCTVLALSAPAKKALFSNESFSIEVPADWKTTGSKTNGKVVFSKGNVMLGGLVKAAMDQRMNGLPELQKYEVKAKKDMRGLAPKAILETLELTASSSSGSASAKNLFCLSLRYEKNRVAYDIYVDSKYVSEQQLIEIGRSFKRSRAGGSVKLIDEKAGRLRIDYIGLNRSADIIDAKRIQKIASFINTIDLEPLSEEEQASIMASSAGGIRITPDNKKGNSVFIYGAGAMSIPQATQGKLGFKTDLCRLSKSDTRKVFEMLQWPQSP
jgi:hypothetical protein